MPKLLTVLRRQAGVRQLLSDVNTNPKIAKNGKVGVLGAVLHLAPGNMSGHEVCPKRSSGCSAACLHFAGSPAYLNSKTQARIKKTKLFFADRDLFMNILVLEIAEHIKQAQKLNMEPSIRLNGTSDIVWERKTFNILPEVRAATQRDNDTITKTNVIECFPLVTFYDYTAIPKRSPPVNYHLTFSMKENNRADVELEAKRGFNIAVVFGSKLPTTVRLGGRDLVVINGDEHDFRPMDPLGCIVGLKAKGTKGKRDASGFVNDLHSLRSNELAA